MSLLHHLKFFDVKYIHNTFSAVFVSVISERIPYLCSESYISKPKPMYCIFYYTGGGGQISHLALKWLVTLTSYNNPGA